MTENKEVKSHVQMPKTVLKHFTDEKERLWYIDCHQKQILPGRARKLNVEVGYYSAEMEEWLNAEIESYLGQLIKLIETIDFEKEAIEGNYEEIVFRYLYSVISRSPLFLKEFCENSRLLQFLPLQQQHDIVAQRGYLCAQENGLLRNCKIGFVNNTTEESFALLTSGVYQVKRGLIIPLTPKRAVMAVFPQYSDDMRIPLFEVDEAELVRAMNYSAFQQELKSNCRYVVANNKETLQNILSKDRLRTN